MKCPNDGLELHQTRSEDFVVWDCSSCKGRGVNLAALRKELPEKLVNILSAMLFRRIDTFLPHYSPKI